MKLVSNFKMPLYFGRYELEQLQWPTVDPRGALPLSPNAAAGRHTAGHYRRLLRPLPPALPAGTRRSKHRSGVAP